MQGIMEAIFESGYLLFGFFAGIFILVNHKKRKDYLLFGFATLVLAGGDSFHLIPRMIALNTTGVENYPFSLGLGKLITSITMTIFYILIYYAFKIRYKKEVNYFPFEHLYISLAIIRIVICALPQNEWFINDSSYIMGIIRNIPFVIMGIMFICISYSWCKNDKYFKYTWLLVSLSFIFYLLTVIIAPFISIMGLMMLPKTICYIIFIASILKSLINDGRKEIN